MNERLSIEITVSMRHHVLLYLTQCMLYVGEQLVRSMLNLLKSTVNLHVQSLEDCVQKGLTFTSLQARSLFVKIVSEQVRCGNDYFSNHAKGA